MQLNHGKRAALRRLRAGDGVMRNWGAVFRFGYLHVPEADFVVIAENMGCDFQKELSLDTSALDTDLEPTR